jgi:hypothetical protein
MYTAALRLPKTRTYLILLKDYLVAQDLEESIAAHDPAAEVIVRQSMASALSALEATQQIAVAFVDVEPLHCRASGLADMIRSRGGEVILMGDEAEEKGEALGWKVLHRPFSEGLVLAHLAALGST